MTPGLTTDWPTRSDDATTVATDEQHLAATLPFNGAAQPMQFPDNNFTLSAEHAESYDRQVRIAADSARLERKIQAEVPKLMTKLARFMKSESCMSASLLNVYLDGVIDGQQGGTKDDIIQLTRILNKELGDGTLLEIVQRYMAANKAQQVERLQQQLTEQYGDSLPNVPRLTDYIEHLAFWNVWAMLAADFHSQFGTANIIEPLQSNVVLMTRTELHQIAGGNTTVSAGGNSATLDVDQAVEATA